MHTEKQTSKKVNKIYPVDINPKFFHMSKLFSWKAIMRKCISLQINIISLLGENILYYIYIK